MKRAHGEPSRDTIPLVTYGGEKKKKGVSKEGKEHSDPRRKKERMAGEDEKDWRERRGDVGWKRQRSRAIIGRRRWSKIGGDRKAVRYFVILRGHKNLKDFLKKCSLSCQCLN